jgi:hypothetical protein
MCRDVNNASVYRLGAYFRKELAVGNASASQYPQVTVHATTSERCAREGP